MTYDTLRVAASLFADYILAHPNEFGGKRIGVMMPAMSGFSVVAMGK